MSWQRWMGALAFGVGIGCGGGGNQLPAAATPPANEPTVDALGDKPAAPAPGPFVPPSAQRSEVQRLPLWTLSRHTVPEVTVVLVLPYGSADDPSARPGLASFTANLLEQGAGGRDAVAFAQAVEALGAELSLTSYADYTTLSLSVLRDRLDPALALMADLVQRPALKASDFAREKDRWLEFLRAQEKNPRALFERAASSLWFGEKHPYGHPRSGTVAAISGVTLAEVRAFYTKQLVRDGATVVAVGDVDAASLAPLLERHFKPFLQGSARRPARTTGAVERASGDAVVIVDRPEAPQALIGWLHDGVAASDERGPVLGRLNAVLGGSFSSRLNQELREDRGLSYGASSRYSWQAGGGQFVASAAVFVERTGEALKAMDEVIAAFGEGGPSEVESERARLLVRGSLVESYESSSDIAARLSRLAGVGLPPEREGQNAQRADAAAHAELQQLAKQQFGSGAKPVRLVVGPRAQLEPQLRAAGYTVAPAR